MTAFFLGTYPVAFSVLVPIAYLLILAAILSPVFRRYPYTFHITSALFVTCALVLNFLNNSNSYIDIFSIGTLGISIGHLSIERVNHFVKRPITMICCLHPVSCGDHHLECHFYPLQIIGVLLKPVSAHILAWACTQ